MARQNLDLFLPWLQWVNPLELDSEGPRDKVRPQLGLQKRVSLGPRHRSWAGLDTQGTV